MLERINAHTVFLGCNGIDPVGGVTNINLPEAEIKRRLEAIDSGNARLIPWDHKAAQGEKIDT